MAAEVGSHRYRARELGILIGRLQPGSLNAIVDVPGMRVGQVSINRGIGALVPGIGPVRTGVTAIWTHPGNPYQDKIAAASFIFNGFGKTVGLPQLQELGTLETPILLTNTLNVPRVADALIDYLLKLDPSIVTVNPVVGECNDSYLNDIRGRHVHAHHVFAALDRATDGPVEEGSVGAGLGMTCYGFKGGIGTSSRRLDLDGDAFTVGALVLSNFGDRRELRIDGVPVGRALVAESAMDGSVARGPGSLMMIVGTDVPLDARQLQRVARRAALGMARTGTCSGHGSGDFVIAFSNANRIAHRPGRAIQTQRVLAEDGPAITEVFLAAVETVEEAILNSLFMATTVDGQDGHVREAIPIDQVVEIMRRHGRDVSMPNE